MRTQLVIFDNDGVLVDSEGLLKRAQIQAFAEDGFEVTERWINDNFMGRRAADNMLLFAEHFGEKPSDKFLPRYRELVGKLFEEELQMVKGVAPLLEKLTQANMATCIATSGDPTATKQKLELTGLKNHFTPEKVFSGEQVEHGKPAPDLFLFAAQNMGIEPENCVVVEDSHLGIKGAKAAGMRAIGFLGGSHVHPESGITEEKLRTAGADHVIYHHEELMEIL